jgi:hypothetical protein
MDSCEFKDILGKPREGVHKLRDPIFDTALTDVLMTGIGAFLISRMTNYRFMMVFLVLFVLGIVLHRVFCVRTTIDKFLFPYSGKDW